MAHLAKSMNSGNWGVPSVISRRMEQGNFRATMFNQPTTKHHSRNVGAKNTRDAEWTSDTVSTEFNYLLSPTIRRMEPATRHSKQNDSSEDIVGDLKEVNSQAFRIGGQQLPPFSRLSLNIDDEIPAIKR